LIERGLEKDERGKETKVIFEDSISRCVQCGIPLFPRSMVRKLEAKIFVNKGSTWELNLCPSCRMKAPFTPHSSLAPVGTTRNRAGRGQG
jgi:hypothetical protein